MSRKAPSYIRELKEDLIFHFDMKIEEVVTRIVGDEVGSLAAMTANEFKRVYQKFDEMEEIMATKDDLKEFQVATKKDFKEIHALIGSYEIRAQNVEQILLKDHKPRIGDLEKEVFA